MPVKATPGTAFALAERLCTSLRDTWQGEAIVLQLLDLAKENARLKSELARLRGELAVLERVLARVLQLVADSATDFPDERRPGP